MWEGQFMGSVKSVATSSGSAVSELISLVKGPIFRQEKAESRGGRPFVFVYCCPAIKQAEGGAEYPPVF